MFNWNFPKSKYPCPENLIANIIEDMKIQVDVVINDAIYRYSHLAKWEQDNEELDADADADTRATYTEIKHNIQNWASNKIW